MRTTVLYIAMSLDGYIADTQGKVDWLEGQAPDVETKDSYTEFIKETDTVVMGWNTYHQIVTELSPDEWVYGALTTYVITHRKKGTEGNIHFTDTAPAELIKKLREREGKNIWICGGADIVSQLTAADLIDRYDLTLIPILLGAGIRLFQDTKRKCRLKLLKAECSNGMTELIYVRR